MSDEAFIELETPDAHIGVTRGSKSYTVTLRRVWDGRKAEVPGFVLSLTPEERRALVNALADREVWS